MRYKKIPAPVMQFALETRLAPLRKTDEFKAPLHAWIRAMREALSMTTGQLAKRVGVSQPRIVAIEKAEADGGITLRTLREVAEGLDCTLIYALVPNKPLKQIVRDRAEQIADRQLARTNHTMKLEKQGLTSGSLKMARERMIEELMKDGRRLWDEP